MQPIYVILDNSVRVGATVIGRRTFDLGVGPRGGMRWPGIPSVVVTHRARQDLLGNNGGMFAFDGLEAAVRRAKQAAGGFDGERAELIPEGKLVAGSVTHRRFRVALRQRR